MTKIEPNDENHLPTILSQNRVTPEGSIGYALIRSVYYTFLIRVCIGDPVSIGLF